MTTRRGRKQFCVHEDFIVRQGAELDRLRAINAELVKAAEHALISYHHPACTAENRHKAYPRCTCHVGKAQAALAKARAT